MTTEHQHPPIQSWTDMGHLAEGARNKSLSDVYDQIVVLLRFAVVLFAFTIPAIIWVAYHWAARA